MRANTIMRLINEGSKVDYRSLLRNIPTGSKVDVQEGVKSLRINVHQGISAPPLMASDVKRTEETLRRDLAGFLKDVKTVIKVKACDFGKYVHMIAKKGEIEFSLDMVIRVGSEVEAKKLAKLAKAFG